MINSEDIKQLEKIIDKIKKGAGILIFRYKNRYWELHTISDEQMIIKK